MQKITPFLWFDGQAEEAANFYVSLFKNSKILSANRYGEGGPGPAGSVMTIAFQLDGQEFVGLNGGPQYKFTEAVSFYVDCETQEEVDFLWEKLTAGGEEQPCGWLKDRFGLSWQIIPKGLTELISNPDAEKSQRAMQAMFTMKKIDLAKMEQAFKGVEVA
jgi:predicted 3-demethylubiquinone-9 3-methyltransferase (glyoxalase superfamily)